jgi:hypothetical protein
MSAKYAYTSPNGPMKYVTPTIDAASAETAHTFGQLTHHPLIF